MGEMPDTLRSPLRLPEPWLRGTRTNMPAVIRGVLHALDLAREDLERAYETLSIREIHASPMGMTPMLFHLRHIPRSLDRLLTYAEGSPLSEAQLAMLRSEEAPEPDKDALIAALHAGLDSAEARVRAFADADLEMPREVGRNGLPTTVGGLLVHVADHTQRHVGQVITTAKLLHALRAVAS